MEIDGKGDRETPIESIEIVYREFIYLTEILRKRYFFV